jgi:hypothetical protein
VICHVVGEGGQTRVESLQCQAEVTTGYASGALHQRSTLHDLAKQYGARVYVGPSGSFTVTLWAEPFAPYRATVRIEW